MMKSHRAFFIYRRILNEQYRNQQSAALAGAVRAMSAMQFDCTAIANATRRRFSAEENYKTLLKLYGRRAAEEVS